MSVELLAPAGDLEKLKIAIMYGANAVFIGGNQYSLRSRASNFTLKEIKEATTFAHLYNASVHVTCNIVMHNIDLDNLKTYLKGLEEANVDAIIVSSMYMMSVALKYTKLPVHVSTQQSVINKKSVEFFTNLGASRVVLGRELDINEIRDITSSTNNEIEVFIHGGMCVSYSGKCVLSNNLTNRDANRGGCAHSCRWNYDIFDNGIKLNKDNDYFAMSSKDLCAIKMIPALIDAKVSSFKIEGRMKSLHYIATIVKTYRMLIDEYLKNGFIKDFSVYENKIKKAENRETSIGFLKGMTTINEQLYDLNKSVPTKEFVGIVLEYDDISKLATIEQRNYFLPNSIIEVFGPKTDEALINIKEIYDDKMNSLDAARHPKQIIKFYTDFKLYPYDMLRIV